MEQLFALVGGIPLVGWLLVPAVAIAGIALHALCAMAVFNDTNKLTAQQRAPELLPGWAWAAFAFLGGLTATVVYWLVHHSTLRRATP